MIKSIPGISKTEWTLLPPLFKALRLSIDVLMTCGKQLEINKNNYQLTVSDNNINIPDRRNTLG